MRASMLLVALALGACGGATTTTTTTTTTRGPTDPCDGADLSLGEAAIHCRIQDPAADPPPAETVVVAITSRTLESGQDAVLDVAFRNAGTSAIDLDFQGALHFDTSIWQGDHRIDERWQISGLAGGSIGCRAGADCRTVRVRLASDGTLVASLPIATRIAVLRDGAARGTIERTDAGPIPPGDYEVRVLLPWSDPVPGSTTAARTPRILRAPITITP